MKNMINRRRLVSFFLLLASMLSSSMADAPVYGDWITNEATATLYRDGQSVNYVHCQLRFRFFPTDRAGRDIRIENLSAKCTHPTYWDFTPIREPGILRLSQDSSGGFKSRVDVDGSVFFLDVIPDGNGIRIEWSERSYENLNFDIISGPMVPATYRRR